MNLISLSIKRPSLLIVFFTITTLAGILSSRYLSYELLPKFNPPRITVTTIYPGAAPAEVENAVTKKIEDLVSGVEKIEQIWGNSYENFSLVRLAIKSDADVDKVVNELQKKISGALNQFPEGVKPPSVGKFDFDALPIIKLALFADLPTSELFNLLKNNVRPALSRLEGVAQVLVLGGQEREIQVNLERKKLVAFHISIGQVLQAIGKANVALPAGKLKSDEGQLAVRLSGKISSLEQLEKVTITTMPDGTAIQLGDIAEIVDATKEAEILSRSNGKDAIGLFILKQSDANAVEVSKRVRKAIAELEDNYAAQNLKIDVFQDNSDFTLEAAQGVFQDLLLAIILVAMVLFVFLQSVRNSLIIMFVVPLSLVATVGLMYLLGFTFNLMSLLGLTLAVGTLVDDAIVVIENIYRHLEMGKSRVQAAYEGTKELGLTLVAMTLTFVIIFIPITLAGGLVSGLLSQFAVTTAVAVLFSLLVAYTLVPFLSSRFAKIEEFSDNPVLQFLVTIFEKSIGWLTNGMTALLKIALNNKTITILAALVFLIAAVALIPLGYIGVDFLEAGDRGEFLVQLELPKNANLEQTNQLAQQAELLLKNRPEVVSVFTTVGVANAARRIQSTPYLAELNVKLIDKTLRKLPADIIARQVKNELERALPGAKIKPVSINILGFADRAPVEIIILGTQPDSLQSFAHRVKAQIASIPGIVELETSRESGNPELRIQPDREKMDALGLTVGQVAFLLRTALHGNTDNKFRDAGTDYDINVRLDASDRKNLEDLLQLSFLNKKGQRIYLYQFAKVTESESPALLERTARATSIAVRAQIVGRPFGDVNSEIVERVGRLRLPPETEAHFEGSQKQQIEGFGSLIIAGVASIMLLYFVLVVLYDSFAYPLVVLLTVPLGVVGAFLALGLSMQVISLFSITGMMLLTGLVAKNAILVVDFTVVLRAQGMELKEALLKATHLRLRPILMTNVSMIIGLVPVALATGAGAEWKNGMAWALIGGLTSSMFLSLIVVPVVYSVFAKMLAALGWDKDRVIELEV